MQYQTAAVLRRYVLDNSDVYPKRLTIEQRDSDRETPDYALYYAMSGSTIPRELGGVVLDRRVAVEQTYDRPHHERAYGGPFLRLSFTRDPTDVFSYRGHLDPDGGLATIHGTLTISTSTLGDTSESADRADYPAMASATVTDGQATRIKLRAREEPHPYTHTYCGRIRVSYRRYTEGDKEASYSELLTDVDQSTADIIRNWFPTDAVPTQTFGDAPHDTAQQAAHSTPTTATETDDGEDHRRA